MSELLIITPIFFLVILIDVCISISEGKEIYKLKDTFSNIIIAICGAIIDLLIKAFILLALTNFSYGSLLFHPVLYWLLLFLFMDLMVYLMHYAEHKIRFLWAAHFIHHSSTAFNFSTSLRITVFQPFYRVLFLIPVVLAGFHPVDLLLVYSISKIYVFFLHTERIGKLGWLELILNTPSHHRVHHAVNPCYLDKNMGNVLIIWDRLFKTYAEETEPVRFGTTKKPESDNSFVHLFFEWNRIFTELRMARTIKDKINSLTRMK